VAGVPARIVREYTVAGWRPSRAGEAKSPFPPVG
jgi:hypothetical protein